MVNRWCFVVGMAVSLSMPMNATGQPAQPATPTPPAQPARPDAPTASPEEKKWDAWLVQVEHVDRQAPTGDDATRIKELTAKSTEATTAVERGKFKTELTRARLEARKRAGFIIYGWGVHADAAGAPVDGNRAMSGFLLPFSDEHAKLLANIKAGALVSIPRSGSQDVFTTGGRRYSRAQSAAKAKPAAPFVGWDPPGKGEVAPPARRETPDALARALDTSLSFVRTQPGDNDGEQHRYMVNIEARRAPESAKRLIVWLNIAIAPTDGAPIGPILERVELKRAGSGEFKISRSLEFITRAGVTLDSGSASIEPVALEWKRE